MSAGVGSAPRTWRGVPVVLPNWRDPRLKVSAVIVALQVLGQVALEFKVSIAQIVVTIAACAVVEVALLYRQRRMLIWPASALLTGNGVTFLLRTHGTVHGDWFTLRGEQWFLLAAIAGLLSKHVIRFAGGRHPFNPSNLGLVAIFLVVGSPSVFPQYLWWGPVSPPVVAALVIVIAGAAWVLRPIGMWPMAATFLMTFFLLTGALAGHGGCMDAIWHQGPVCGVTYWRDICLSPELLIFVFYMMSDPMTAPRAPRGRVVYAAVVAVLAVAAIASQSTEYGIKVALLAALTFTCALVPAIDAVVTRGLPRPNRAVPPRRRLTPAVAAAAAIALALPAGLYGLASDNDLTKLERGITGTGTPAGQ